MAKPETIPADEGDALLSKKPTGGRGVAVQPKNDYFGSQIVAGKCKHGNSKQQWEVVGEKVRHTPS